MVMDARRAPGDVLSRRHTVLKDTLENHADVKQVSSMGAVPGRNGWRGQISFPEGWPEGKSISLEYIPVEYGFEETLGLEVIAGRSFDPSFPTDEKQAVMINQTAAKEVGWASPADAIGKGFSSPGSGKPDGVVIGVVEDYHHHGLQERIQPLMFGFRQVNGYFMLRVQNGKYGAVIHHVNKVWDRFFSGYPMNAFFLNESFARQYEQEKQLERIFLTFTFFTLLIASLGLFGLTTFATSQRVKEIGVRKVLGAKVRDIVWLLSMDFMKLVLIAYAAAVPIGYFLMNRWLQSFAYRITLKPGIFLINALIIFSIAFLTVSVKTVKTALSDPSQSLRYE
jgi:putative ABC transport system permease protein